MEATPVHDIEDLYRAIRADRGEFTVTADGQLKFSASAFNDRDRTPSVDRSSIRTEPRDTRINATDGVTVVRAAQVRSIRTIRIDPGKKMMTASTKSTPSTDPSDDDDPGRKPRPRQIECRPSIATDNHYRKLKEALASQHTWITVNPTSKLDNLNVAPRLPEEVIRTWFCGLYFDKFLLRARGAAAVRSLWLAGTRFSEI
jgi:hypothetical protein